jgi:serpin B
MAVLTSVACGTPSVDSRFADQRSNKARLTTEAPATAIQEVIDGNTAFALDIYREAKAKPGNLFFSPHSISVALAMTYAGARGDTASAMQRVLHIVPAPPDFHHAMNSLDLALSKRGANAPANSGNPFRLNIVNQAWGQNGYQFLPDYLDTLAVHYGAGLKTVDFLAASEESRVAINAWVLEKTEQRIKDLLPQGSVTPDTRLVLTNAVYFKASWKTTFEKNLTQNGAFSLLDGTTAQVPMMTQTESLRFAEVNGTQAIELPYQGDEVSLVVLLPAKGTFADFEGSINVGSLKSLIAALAPKQIELKFPKFSAETDLPLTQALQKLGMGVAFSGDADFSGMNGKRDLAISEVLHKGFVAVDEAGTEAAAATAVVIRETSAPPPATTVNVDRPFMYLVRDRVTGAVLFLGRVVQP